MRMMLSSRWAERRASKRAFVLVFLALAAWMSGSSWGATVATLYVDRSNASCSDTGPGTAAQPFCTIGAGAAVVTAGQTVQVASGTYPESVAVPRSGTASAPIVFTGAPGATVTLAGQANGFSVSGQSWVTVNGFAVTGTTSYGIYVSNSAHITISGNHVTYSGQPVSGKTKPGIRLSNVTDSLVDGNTADHNSYAGIELMSGSTRNVVSRNETFANARQYERAAPGIRLYGAPGNTVARNISHDNEDSGIEAYPGSNNTLIYDNVTYGNGDHGIDNLTSTGERIVANTVYDNVTAGINVEGGSTGAALANNISVDNGIKSPRTHSNIRIERGSTAGTTLDHDLVFLTTPDTMMIWDSTSYSSLAAFQAASGQEAHGIQADPRWVSPGSGDFHLRAGSPAIDSANSGASGQPGSDFEGNNHVDDPSTPNTGVGPRAYDDRGAYEFQPGGVSNSPPSAALAVTPSSGPAPLAVTADASGSADPDGNIASYAFDFGDGSAPVGPQMGATTTHTYPSTGAFTVTVTVTDSGGLSSTAVRQVTVSPPADAPPDPVLAVTPVSGVAPLDVIADGSGSTDADGTPIASYRFDFGDGTPVVGPQAGATAGHTYASAGAFTVTMTVTDTGGLSSSATRQVTVSATNTAPTAALSVSPTSGSAPLVVAADASGSTDPEGNITSYRFDFGDGTPVVGPQPGATATHTYTSPGTYTVTMTVADTGGLSSTATAQVNATVTNLVGNPGFETDLSGWNTSGSGSGIALTRVDGGHSGSWAAKLTNTGATNATCTLNDSPDWARPTQAGTYTGTIWVRGDTAGATLKLRFREWSGSTLAGSQTTTVTLASSWQQVAVAYTVQSPGSSLDFNAYLASADAPPGTCFYADDIAITVS
jgi:parallel beta-helix repeat protein